MLPLHLGCPFFFVSNLDFACNEAARISRHGVLSLKVQAMLVLKRKSCISRTCEAQNELKTPPRIGNEVFIAKTHRGVRESIAQGFKDTVFVIPHESSCER